MAGRAGDLIDGKWSNLVYIPCLSENNFIPQIRVPIPYIKQWNYNTTIKIDDIGFCKTNPGVWVHSLHELQSVSNFTNWREYSNDEEI